jgi:hypothetical protein
MNDPSETQFKVEYSDRPDVSETFSDSVSVVLFDGQVLRIELCATRFDPTQPTSAPRAVRVPVCRLAMPPGAAVDLFNRLQQTMASLVQQGVLKQTPSQMAESRKPDKKLS